MALSRLIAPAALGHEVVEETLGSLSRSEDRAALPADGRMGDLVSGARDVREQAWRSLYDDQFARVHRLASRFGAPPAEVEDVVQQVFLVAYRRIGEVGEVANVPGWLRGIAVKVIAEHHRWRRVRRVKEWVVNGIYGDGAAHPITPVQGAEEAEAQQRFSAVLRRMRPKLRAVLVLCDIEECSLGEVAETLQIPLNTVRSRRRLARESFRKMWQEGGA